GVVILGLAGGFFLVRRVVRPLRALEQGLLAIDEGRARELSLPSKDQEIRSFVAAFNRMLKRMRQQQDQVRRNEKAAALGVLVSGVAHELNNPLSNISTSAQLLLEEGETVDAETRRLWLAQIDSETERSRRIVRRLLDSVRSPKAHAQRQSLLDVIESSVALVKRQIPPAVDLRVGTRDDIDVAVDRERLQQVFINLIKNAADAGARHIMVNVWLAAWDEALAEAGHLEGDPAAVRQAGRAARVTVEDDGPGIAPELRENVFAPFFTTRSTGDGTGLGLYLVNEIVGEHRGCIVVDSPATGGTRFSIWLPLNEENVA
ncbi:MAG: HAMP domain-containing histidine kinase, partial [Gammaproteobacteria bacterium]|nr:HAMP domain-containing histidine kinase [Gammaproteobacteria bacterium]